LGDGQRKGEGLVLAVASGGGHWEELMLLRPALDRFDPVFATTHRQLAEREGLRHIHVLPDSNRDQPLRALRCLWHSFRLVLSLRPAVVVTTGALPGLFCLISARLLGARTLWIDSIANSDKPSLSGTLARPFSTLWLTQWEHLADEERHRYRGALL
jgi:UDP-N-acetylglucosamine:LPS N-acetylglucosamine transferase